MTNSNAIMIYENFLLQEECDSFIKIFEQQDIINNIVTKKTIAVDQSEIQIGNINSVIIENNSQFNCVKIFTNKFISDAYSLYKEKFTILDSLAKHILTPLKIQKTPISGGYHIWHCENGNSDVSNRILSFILFLNDVNEGGDLEFLYQSKKIKPAVGKLVIFPCNFVYTHRGNPPISNDKFILTGWVSYSG